jgi:hypothetical protein
MGDKVLRVFNTTACAVTVLLATWAFAGDDISRPLENISLFEKLNLLEIRDRLSPAIVVLVVVNAYLFSNKLRINSLTVQLAIAIVTTAGFVLSISSYLIDDDVAWAGLGKSVAVVSLGLAIIVLYFQPKIEQSIVSNKKIVTLVSALCLVVLVAAYLPSISQFSGGITDLFASSTVFNELLLPITGITPLGNFASQYTSMLGWPLLALKGLSPEVVMNGVLVWLFVLTLFQIMAIAAIGKSIFKKIPYPLILLYVSSLILMKGEKQDEIAGSIVGSFFSIPSRTFFPSVLGLLLLSALFENKRKRMYQIVLGALLPITALNNLEFGVPAVVATMIVVLTIYRLRLVERKVIVLILGSAIATFGIIALAFALRSAPLDFGLWTAMVRAQGSGGYMNVPMPVLDTYLLVFAILSAGIVIGLKSMSATTNPNVMKSSAIAIFAGAWGVMSMPYYTGRSWPSHIQVFFIPLTICIFGIAGIFYYSNYFAAKKLTSTEKIVRLPLMLTLVLPIATLLIAPNPATEWSRATGGGFEWSFENQSKTKVVTSVFDAIKRYELDINKSVYFGDQYASTVQLITGMRNGLGVNTLEYSLVSADLRELACRRLPELNPQIVVSQNDDTRINFVGPSRLDSSCPGMTVLHAPDDIGVTIFSYTKPNE